MTLAAFTPEERERAHVLLADRVARMMGRKFEEDDWSFVYCQSKNIPQTGWSNLHLDVNYGGLGVEHKMLKRTSKTSLLEFCGTTQMHPAATRSIRIQSFDLDPNEVMVDVLTQFGDLINQRRDKVAQQCPSKEPDLRLGWLIWQQSLYEFLYFEEQMVPPNPLEYYAEWNSKNVKMGARKPSKSLWIYEKASGKKRYSVTTESGIKIQPYFDVPPPSDPHLYLFRVQGEEVDNVIRVWLTPSTYRELKHSLGELSLEVLDEVIQGVSRDDSVPIDSPQAESDLALEVLLTREAYAKLKNDFAGSVSDEHSFRMLLAYLRN